MDNKKILQSINAPAIVAMGKEAFAEAHPDKHPSWIENIWNIAKEAVGEVISEIIKEETPKIIESVEGIAEEKIEDALLPADNKPSRSRKSS